MSRAHQYWRMRHESYGRRGQQPPDIEHTREQEIRRWQRRRGPLCPYKSDLANEPDLNGHRNLDDAGDDME